MAVATTFDNRQIVMQSLFPAGVFLCYTGAGDTQVANGRGKGQSFVASTTTAGTQRVEWQFCDQVYMAAGTCTWDNALVGDNITFGIVAKASTANMNLMNKGNVTLVNGKWMPASGNGNYDLTQAVPVPNSAGQGAWVWDFPDTGLGNVTPAPADLDRANALSYDLYAVQVPLANYISQYNITGTRARDFVLPAIKPQVILPHWTCYAQVTSGQSRSTPLVVVWAITLARSQTVNLS